jgi:hypothetical protein
MKMQSVDNAPPFSVHYSKQIKNVMVSLQLTIAFKEAVLRYRKTIFNSPPFFV